MTAITLQLLTTNANNPSKVKHATLKVPDRATRTSMVMLAKKWASLTGVKSTTIPIDINTFKVDVPDAECYILVEVDRLDEKYADQLIMHENKQYIWYERENAPKPHVSYRMKDNKQTLKGVWR